MNNKIVYDYDRQGDSLFIYCVDDYEYKVSLELENDVIGILIKVSVCCI